MEIRPLETDKIICVKVGKVARENLYEMARKYWVMKLERAEKATHVLAIINGIVEAVYIPTEWKYSEERIGRCEFIGYEEYDSDYIGKNVNRFYGKSQNPVKYINM
jgi:hypothetical protein